MSILQLLAKSIGEADGGTATDSTQSRAEPTSGKPAEQGGSSSSDPNAIALALLSQSLAAALGGAAAAPQAATVAGAVAAANTSIDAIADAMKSMGGAALRDLVSLIAQDATAGSKANSVGDPSQLAAAAPKSAPTDSAATSSIAAAPASIAHLGIASHLPLQHSQTDNNTPGELRSLVGSSSWNDELGGQLLWMTHQGIESGSLKLSPEHLGPVEVTISVQNGDASVWFGANHADTRAALEQALPRLREMFASQGLTLTDSGVSRESPRNQPQNASPAPVSATAAIGGTEAGTPAAVRVSLGLVDTYA